MNYYAHHIGDFDQATAHLTACEDGIYSRLIRRCYATEKPLPAEVSAVQRLVRARTRDEKKAVADMLAEFFNLQADGWHQTRCDIELARYAVKQEKARASAYARWGNQTCETDANALRTHCEGNAPRARSSHQTPVTSNQEKTKTNAPAKKRACAIPENFSISENVRAWAADKGFANLERHLEHFRGYAKANGKMYSDWDHGFMNAIRDDWAKLRNGTAVDYAAAVAHLPGD